MSEAEIEAEANKRIDAMGLGPKVTYSNFNRIKSGMSKGEVFGILGYEYEVMSENELAGIHTEMLMWKQGFGNCNVMFQNDKVIQKAQFGLK